jgi:hypothetical protein
VDAYCAAYRGLFTDVRSFEHFCLLHIGLLPGSALCAST